MRLNYILGVGIVLSLIGASLLVAFGLLYLRPHLDVRHLVEGQCAKSDIGYTRDIVTCTCASDGGSSCQSQYPCLRITVNVSSKGSAKFVADNATLYDSYETFVLQSSAFQVSMMIRQVSSYEDSCLAGKYRSRVSEPLYCGHIWNNEGCRVASSNNPWWVSFKNSPGVLVATQSFKWNVSIYWPQHYKRLGWLR